MKTKYEVLEDGHDASVYCGDTLLAVFYGADRSLRAQQFVAREEYLARSRREINRVTPESIARAKRDAMLQGPGRN